MDKDRHDEALEILKKYHGEGVMTDYVALEYQEIKETLALEKEYGRRGWSELFRTPGNRKRASHLLPPGLLLAVVRQRAESATTSFPCSTPSA